MRSMTGFGHATGDANGRRCIVEMRSFNHRFFDLKLRLPALWVDPLLEQLIGQALRKRINRGSLIVTVREDGPVAARPTVQVDQELARAYGRAFGELWRGLGLKPDATTPESTGLPLNLSDDATARLFKLVVGQPGVLALGESGLDTEQRFKALEPILDQSISALLTTRQREGEALARDLESRLGVLTRLLDEVSRLVESAPEQHRRKLSDRIARLLDGTQLDAQRLAQEVALIADRQDVTEEITRLRTHMAEFARLFRSEILAGRQLDFLTQEMNREVNTIGSKAQSAEVAARVVAMKAELERLREQIQNVE